MGPDLRRDGDAASGALRDLASRLREGDGPEDLSGLGERPGRTRPRIRRARDSLRLNPRSGRRRVEADRLESAFTMLRNAIEATRAIAGLLDPDHRPSPDRLDPGFRDHYANSLDRAADDLDDRLAAVLSSADPPAPAPPGPDIEALEHLAAQPDGAEVAELQGALLAALRRLLRAMDA